jgi:hypothetical protein
VGAWRVGIYQFERAGSSVRDAVRAYPICKICLACFRTDHTSRRQTPALISAHFRKKLQMCNLEGLGGELNKGVRLASLTPASVDGSK